MGVDVRAGSDEPKQQTRGVAAGHSGKERIWEKRQKVGGEPGKTVGCLLAIFGSGGGQEALAGYLIRLSCLV